MDNFCSKSCCLRTKNILWNPATIRSSLNWTQLKTTMITKKHSKSNSILLFLVSFYITRKYKGWLGTRMVETNNPEENDEDDDEAGDDSVRHEAAHPELQHPLLLVPFGVVKLFLRVHFNLKVGVI